MINNVSVFVCVCVCVCLRDGRKGQGSRERQVASATRRGHVGDAHSAACAAAAPPAATRRISGALSESGCAAQPAEHAPAERCATRARRRRRGRRADARVVGVGGVGEARRLAPAPEAVAVRAARQKTLLEGWGAACRRAARRASPLPATRSRARSHGTIQRAITPEAARPGPVGLPRQLGEAVQSAESMLGRLPSSDEPCWLLAGGELEDPSELRPARRARPHARGRRHGRPASWRFLPALTCQKTPRSAREESGAVRLGAARAASRRGHQARGRRAPSHRRGRRGSREPSTHHTVFLAGQGYPNHTPTKLKPRRRTKALNQAANR